MGIFQNIWHNQKKNQGDHSYAIHLHSYTLLNRTFAIRFRYLLMNAVASQPAFILLALSISHHFLTTNLRHLRQI